MKVTIGYNEEPPEDEWTDEQRASIRRGKFFGGLVLVTAGSIGAGAGAGAALALPITAMLGACVVGLGLSGVSWALLSPMGRKALPGGSQSISGSLPPVNNQAPARGCSMEEGSDG